jgi:hypothetical protein
MISKERLEIIKNFYENMKVFESLDDLDYISIPVVEDKEFYNNVIIKNLIRCGAIPKSKLVNGKLYAGTCRNASEARWVDGKFIYTRHKFGYIFDEKINHFEDDNGFDLFVPLYEIL